MAAHRSLMELMRADVQAFGFAGILLHLRERLAHDLQREIDLRLDPGQEAGRAVVMSGKLKRVTELLSSFASASSCAAEAAVFFVRPW